MQYCAVLWGITGGGTYLRESAEVMEGLSRRGLRVTIMMSRWGAEVVRIYGVEPIIRRIATGDYLRELLVGDGAMYYVGRLALGRYRVFVVAPATANTVAKFVLGIEDTAVTAAFAQAEKSGVPIVVLPTEAVVRNGKVISVLPCYISSQLCRLPEEGRCVAADACPVNAIVERGVKASIDISRCIGCEVCVKACPYGAVRCWETVLQELRSVDRENIERLSTLPGVVIVRSPQELEDALLRFVGDCLEGTPSNG